MKKSNLLSLLGVFALILTGCQTPVESPSSNEQSVPSSEQENSSQSEVSSENKESSSSVEESSPSEDPAALLEQYKEAKVAEVSAYVSLENYRADEQTLITEALNTAKVFIGSATSEAEVDEVVASYKAAVGSLKTNQQYEEEYPDRKVFLIDSLSAGPELKLIVEKIQELNAEIEAEKEKAEELKEYEKYVQTDKFKAEEAKRKLGLVFPDEILFKQED